MTTKMMMIKVRRSSIFALTTSLLLSLLVLHFTSIKAQEVDNEREFDYIKGSDKGPEKWGDLHPEWSACKNGKMQSPIDISHLKVKIIPSSTGIQRNYKPTNATINNRGHDIMVEWERESDVGSVLINGTKFDLQQVHWHIPSEHTIDNKRYNMELHMVHRNSNGKIAVIAVLYKFGKPDPFLNQLKSSILSMIEQKVEHIEAGVVNPMEIQVSDKLYRKYIGSLTTPPCTEGVIWIVSGAIKSVAVYQVKLLHEAVHEYANNNARPLQALNGREVHLYFSPGKGKNSVVS